MSNNIHDGHRERLKAEFLNGGFNNDTPPHKWLELLLFYSVTRKDTNPLAHELISKYKTLNGVLEAPVSELIKFDGLTKNNVGLLKMIIPIARQCEIQKGAELLNSLTPQDTGDYILSKFYGLESERFGVAFINQMGRIADFKFIGNGDIAQIGVSVREIVKYVMEFDASCIVIAHNHPTGFALPSSTDIETTKNLCDILSRINVRLLDHIIISNNDYVSLANSRDYEHIFK